MESPSTVVIVRQRDRVADAVPPVSISASADFRISFAIGRVSIRNDVVGSRRYRQGAISRVPLMTIRRAADNQQAQHDANGSHDDEVQDNTRGVELLNWVTRMIAIMNRATRKPFQEKGCCAAFLLYRSSHEFHIDPGRSRVGGSAASSNRLNQSSARTARKHIGATVHTRRVEPVECPAGQLADASRNC